jgi:hypothetical protein
LGILELSVVEGRGESRKNRFSTWTAGELYACEVHVFHIIIILKYVETKMERKLLTVSGSILRIQ